MTFALILSSASHQLTTSSQEKFLQLPPFFPCMVWGQESQTRLRTYGKIGESSVLVYVTMNPIEEKEEVLLKHKMFNSPGTQWTV